MTNYSDVKRAYRDFAKKHGAKAADAIVQKVTDGPIEGVSRDEYDAVLKAFADAENGPPVYGKDVKFADVHGYISKRAYDKFNARRPRTEA